MNQDQPYAVVTDEDRYLVTDAERRKILSCRDQASAEHYATLLTQAYRRGYRQGYREAKRAES